MVSKIQMTGITHQIQTQFSLLVKSLGIQVRTPGFKSWLHQGTEPLIHQSPHLEHGHYFERLLE